MAVSHEFLHQRSHGCYRPTIGTAQPLRLLDDNTRLESLMVVSGPRGLGRKTRLERLYVYRVRYLRKITFSRENTIFGTVDHIRACPPNSLRRFCSSLFLHELTCDLHESIRR